MSGSPRPARGIVRKFEARFAGARAARLAVMGGEFDVPALFAVRPSKELEAGGPDHEARTRLLRSLSSLLENRIIMTPSAAEFAKPAGDEGVAICPARRGVRDDLAALAPHTVLMPHLFLIEEGRTLADILAEVRSACPAAAVVAPGCGHPWRLAVYAYLGVDIVDTSTVLPVLAAGMSASTHGFEECDCHPSPFEHLESSARAEERRVRRAIVDGGFRELVERRALHEPFLMSALRHADVAHSGPGSFVEDGFPVDCEVNASSREALYRPDLARWRRRLRERYQAPAWAKVLLLSPCSYKKPYASSRTHQKLDELLRMSGLAAAVHKVVVTSPVGLVPEELDCLPPASSYDIPVIGVWDANEREMIGEELASYLELNKYDLVINHVSNDIPALRDLSNASTVDDHPLSPSSMGRLLKELRGSGLDAGQEQRRLRFLAQMDALARFQFGTPLGFDFSRRERIPQGFRSVLRIGGEEAAHWAEAPLQLLAGGAKALAAKRVHLVTIEDISLKGDVFAPGVVESTTDFRRGDEVAVVASKPTGPELRAAGIAGMSALDIRECGRGRAVKVRRRFGAPAGLGSAKRGA